MKKKKYRVELFLYVLLFFCLVAEKKNYDRQTSDSRETVQIEKQVKQENEQKKQEKKIAYLTFDDGPSQVTNRVLDILDAYEIKGTFFLIGSSITEDQKATVLRMKQEGHAIGIHTYSHKAEEMYQSADAFEHDFLKAERRLKKIVGENTTLYRFPWGSANNYLRNIESDVLPWLEQKGYYYCDWNVSGEDSVGTPTSYSIYRNVQKDYDRYTEPVILLHDSATNELTAQVLPDIIVM